MSASLVVALILLVGVVLIAVEVFLVPGVGVAGIAGAIVLLAGAGVAWFTLGPLWGVGSLVLAAALTLLGLTVFARSAASRRFVLEQPPSGHVGDERPRDLVGEEGVALTPLRPSGTAQLGEQRYTVVTEGTYAAAGSRVRVVETEGSRIVVEVVRQQGDIEHG